MPELWFVAGVALGTIVTGFCAVGAFERGANSARNRSWSREHVLRTLAAPRQVLVVAQQPAARVAKQRPFIPAPLVPANAVHMIAPSTVEGISLSR